MKSLLVGFLLLVVASSANAAFTRDAGNNYATDGATGLDWLALSETSNQPYTEFFNVGWRFATYTEVNAMFVTIFTDYANENSQGYSTGYTGISTEIETFQSIFGFSETTFYHDSLGYYMDDNGYLRVLGTTARSSETIVYGINYNASFDGSSPSANKGSFLVRNTVVPEPSTIYLLAFGLLGLSGASRRKV